MSLLASSIICAKKNSQVMGSWWDESNVKQYTKIILGSRNPRLVIQFLQNAKNDLTYHFRWVYLHIFSVFSHIYLSSDKNSKSFQKVPVPSTVGCRYIPQFLNYLISLMAVAKSEDRNQGHIRCYLQGNVADCYQKTNMNAPPKNLVTMTPKRLQTTFVKFLSFSQKI